MSIACHGCAINFYIYFLLQFKHVIMNAMMHTINERRQQQQQRNSQISMHQMHQIQFGVEKGVGSTAPRVCVRQVLDRH